MPISPSAERSAAGFTLFETLVALAIASLVAAAAAAFVRVNMPGLTMTVLVDQTAGDLRRARLEVRRTGRPLAVSVSETGYTIGDLAIDREWENGVRARWNGTRADGFEIVPAPAAAEPVRLELDYSGLEAAITLQPISGRVDVLRE